jgi:hypothetical protein
MTKPRLRFYCRGTAQVTDVHAQERGVRRCVGRRWQEVLPGRWAWVPTGQPQETEYSADLVKAARDGDLWPADQATAGVCGVAFDATFGGEVAETIKAFKSKVEEDKQPASPAPASESGGGKGKSGGGKGDV